jgi:hypothetical protein
VNIPDHNIHAGYAENTMAINLYPSHMTNVRVNENILGSWKKKQENHGKEREY